MPKQPFEQLSKRQRNAIFRVCCELFAQNGYDHTSVKMITRRLRVADGYLYYYFEGKQDLAKWVIAKGNKLWYDHFQAHVMSKNPADVFELFRMLVTHMIQFIQDYRELYGAYHKLINEPNFPLAPYLIEQISWIDRVFQETVEQGIRNGLLRSDIPPIFIVMALDLFNTRLQEFFYNPGLDPIGISSMSDTEIDGILTKTISLLRDGLVGR